MNVPADNTADEYGCLDTAFARLRQSLKEGGPEVDYGLIFGFVDGFLSGEEQQIVQKRIVRWRSWHDAYWDVYAGLCVKVLPASPENALPRPAPRHLQRATVQLRRPVEATQRLATALSSGEEISRKSLIWSGSMSAFDCDWLLGSAEDLRARRDAQVKIVGGSQGQLALVLEGFLERVPGQVIEVAWKTEDGVPIGWLRATEPFEPLELKSPKGRAPLPGDCIFVRCETYDESKITAILQFWLVLASPQQPA